ncbi:hypothetical protein KC926_03315 [Candidatus Kaiserbacteria bacterium]|nr:hypothetical protein [Candidatus Kaiserbacteria bacterium]
MSENINVEITGSPEKTIPKFCSNVGVNVLANEDVVLQFGHRKSDKEPLVIIETILVDKEHALQISKVIKETVEKSSKN